MFGQAVGDRLLQPRAARIISIHDRALPLHVDILRQIQIIIANRVDRLVVIRMQVTIAIIGIIRGLFGRRSMKIIQQSICTIVRMPAGFIIQVADVEIDFRTLSETTAIKLCKIAARQPIFAFPLYFLNIAIDTFTKAIRIQIPNTSSNSRSAWPNSRYIPLDLKT